MAESADDPTRLIIAAALKLAAERPWREVALADIAAASGFGLIELYRVLPSKAAILTAFGRQIDAEVLETPADLTEAPRDRLFDLLMRRFEALAPYRSGLRSILRAGPAGLPLAHHLRISLRWLIEAAGLSAPGLTGAARVKVLGVAYLSVLRSFMADDTPDLARTMAALDKALRRAAPWLHLPSAPVAAAA